MKPGAPGVLLVRVAVQVAYASIIAAGGLASEVAYPYVVRAARWYMGCRFGQAAVGSFPCPCAYRVCRCPCWFLVRCVQSGGGQDFKCKSPLPAPSGKISNYTVLPSNQAAPLLNAIANVGPIAIAVDASSWGAYAGGVFDGCDQSNPDLDHAVQVGGAAPPPSAWAQGLGAVVRHGPRAGCTVAVSPTLRYAALCVRVHPCRAPVCRWWVTAPTPARATTTLCGTAGAPAGASRATSAWPGATTTTTSAARTRRRRTALAATAALPP